MATNIQYRDVGHTDFEDVDLPIDEQSDIATIKVEPCEMRIFQVEMAEDFSNNWFVH